jgi:pimeloyl-ACP methyl ester carboxylesterase
MQSEVKRHTVRDVNVRTLTTGSGEPLVFLHGAGGMPLGGRFLEGLAASFTVTVPEHPGFGQSDTPQTIRNIGDMAMYCLDMLASLKLGRVHLVGASLGGWIAAEAAIRNTTHIASLSLMAPAGLRVKGVPIGDNFIWSPEENVRNLVHDQKLADAMLAATPTEAEMEEQLKNRFMVTRLGWEPRWFDPALARWLHRVDVPALVLWGAEDQLFPARFAQEWGERIPGAAIEILPGCGHLMHLEKPDAVVDRIATFIGRR